MNSPNHFQNNGKMSFSQNQKQISKKILILVINIDTKIIFNNDHKTIFPNEFLKMMNVVKKNIPLKLIVHVFQILIWNKSWIYLLSKAKIKTKILINGWREKEDKSRRKSILKIKSNRLMRITWMNLEWKYLFSESVSKVWKWQEVKTKKCDVSQGNIEKEKIKVETSAFNDYTSMSKAGEGYLIEKIKTKIRS